MKSYLPIVVAAFTLGGGLPSATAQDRLTLPGATAPAANSAPAAAASAPMAPAQVFTESQVLEVIGWVMGRNSQADTFGFTPDQLVSIAKGFAVAAADKDAPYPLEKIGPQIDEYVKKKQDAWIARLKAKGEAESAAYFSELHKKPGVVFLPSGLAYEIVKPGSGANPKPSDLVKAHYTGTLVNGEVFGTSREPAEPGGTVQPEEFPLDQVIPAWTEGLQKIAKGGQIKLYVPAKLGYGDEGRSGVPPASALIFDIEVLDFRPAPGPASLMPAGK